MNEKKGNRLQITELILVMANLERTFTGVINRGIDDQGLPVVFGKVKVDEGLIYSSASSEDELGRNMDEMCVLKLDFDLHADEGAFKRVGESRYFLN